MEKCKVCSSSAINPEKHGRDLTDLDLCDVCYWRKRARPVKKINKIASGRHKLTEADRRKSSRRPKINDNERSVYYPIWMEESLREKCHKLGPGKVREILRGYNNSGCKGCVELDGKICMLSRIHCTRKAEDFFWTGK
jgi:hypothetical protein